MPEPRDPYPAGRPGPILVLGGTAEANALVEGLSAIGDGREIVLSLAGRTTAPDLPDDTSVRTGGFGGAEGLTDFLAERRVSALVDATHPFATLISENAFEACRLAAVPRIALVRPAWTPVEGDLWHPVPNIDAARDALPRGCRPFLALGRQHLSPFAARPDLRPVVRMIERPAHPLGFEAELLLSRPSDDPEEEAQLFVRYAITHLVCRNAGGSGAHAKIAAARALGLPVVLIERPSPPPPPLAPDVGTALRWLCDLPSSPEPVGSP